MTPLVPSAPWWVPQVHPLSLLAVAAATSATFYCTSAACRGTQAAVDTACDGATVLMTAGAAYVGGPATGVAAAAACTATVCAVRATSAQVAQVAPAAVSVAVGSAVLVGALCINYAAQLGGVGLQCTAAWTAAGAHAAAAAAERVTDRARTELLWRFANPSPQTGGAVRPWPPVAVLADLDEPRKPDSIESSVSSD